MYDSWNLQAGAICCVHSGTLARIFFARCSALQEVFFVAPSSLCSVSVPQKVVFHDLHHYIVIDPLLHAHVNAISDPHTHTHTLMEHTMHHTLHTQIHMIYAIAQRA